ncbi:[NiFe] hydrogenase maturation protein HypF [Hahella chejuensis KCTC 2396]|uniref:Carbamoyltransferase HypF n=1 Tax=Hahella chejuensis (strain KCTC 2396) TaxID=349521 RepID=Q2SQS8_HAHCH|nr:carbamoyltransferase HypF [Hahella chejuensis]ABC26996.1 [NiFe] hydrogenase maturation protein HypF [Hahella chejuensis KCTC 2396]
MATAAPAREILTLSGVVQGVGFRPFAYRLATSLGLVGKVWNQGGDLLIDIQGSPSQLQAYKTQLLANKPTQAQVRALAADTATVIPHRHDFAIVDSTPGAVQGAIPVDLRLCAQCLNELFDPHHRRYRYPFITCAECGPRYSLIRRLPFDRARTSMDAFPQCPACLHEYNDPEQRRHHAQTNSCAACGPALQWYDKHGDLHQNIDPIAAAWQGLSQGQIIAVKGVGGVHLLCDAGNARAVADLRQRKQRPHKPFAIMTLNRASLAGMAEIDDHTEQLLQGADAPIALTRKGPDCDRRLSGVAPQCADIGVMYPYAPIHYLLFHQALRCPADTTWLEQAQPLTLVVTSANLSGEPLITDNAQCLRDLQGVADGFLLHNRDILARSDDSVLQNSQPAIYVRRGRGLAPNVIELAQEGPSVLAFGGFLKNTLCVSQGNRAFVSPYIGDLDRAAACRDLDLTVERLLETLAIQPDLIACDLHPDFYSTQAARRYSERLDVPLLQVQHHHAHCLATMAEAGLRGPVLGLALDGFGLGDDGGIWGGELLWMNGADYRRLGGLRPLPLPGGDSAVREPWRLGVAALLSQGREEDAERLFGAHPGYAMLRQMLAKNVNCPRTSSAGRYFDAAAAILGVRHHTDHEAHAAMALETLCRQTPPTSDASFLFEITSEGALDLYPLLDALTTCEPHAGARLFHDVLVRGLLAWVDWARAKTGVGRIALGGGCFLNRVLRESLTCGLRARGMQVHAPRQMPPNDSGISLGQVWYAYLRAQHQPPAPNAVIETDQPTCV